MTTGDRLLPGSSGPFTRALAFAGSDTLPVPIAEILDPARTPEAFLPFLAAHEGVRLWWQDWPVARKRAIVVDWTRLAGLIGTRAAAAAFLAYVDTVIVHKRSHPSRSPVGRIAAGRSAIQFPDLTARYLLKLRLERPRGVETVGRTAVGRAVVRSARRGPIDRALTALSMSKGTATAYSATFAHRTPISLSDSFDLSAGHVLGGFRDRTHL